MTNRRVGAGTNTVGVLVLDCICNTLEKQYAAYDISIRLSTATQAGTGFLACMIIGVNIDMLLLLYLL